MTSFRDIPVYAISDIYSDEKTVYRSFKTSTETKEKSKGTEVRTDTEKERKQEEVEQKDESVKDNRDRCASHSELEDVYYQNKTRNIGTTAKYRYNTLIQGNGN